MIKKNHWRYEEANNWWVADAKDWKEFVTKGNNHAHCPNCHTLLSWYFFDQDPARYHEPCGIRLLLVF